MPTGRSRLLASNSALFDISETPGWESGSSPSLISQISAFIIDSDQIRAVNAAIRLSSTDIRYDRMCLRKSMSQMNTTNISVPEALQHRRSQHAEATRRALEESVLCSEELGIDLARGMGRCILPLVSCELPPAQWLSKIKRISPRQP